MRNNFPEDCRECDKSNTCNNPGPYGSFQCAYRPQIMEAAIQEALLPLSEALTPMLWGKTRNSHREEPESGHHLYLLPHLWNSAPGRHSSKGHRGLEPG